MELVILFLPMALYVVLAVAAVVLGVRFVRAFEQRAVARQEWDALQARVTELEDALGQARDEFQRLHEGQRFTMDLLDERRAS